jgi:hypothetical protein
MPAKEKHVFEAQSPAIQVTRLAFRTRDEKKRVGSETRLGDGQEFRPGNGFSREVILRLIDWIKAL